MRLLIRHITRYRYSRPVFIEPTLIRLRPCSNVAQRLNRFSITIDPEPTGMNERVELESNNSIQTWFDGTHDSLTITAESEVETLLVDPFNYVLPEHAMTLPLGYDATRAAMLQPHLNRQQGHADVDAYARELLEASDHQTGTFLSSLVQRLNKEIAVEIRDEGDSLPPEQTLSSKRGACRDTALLFMDACRSVGLAARFVSGYKAYDLRDSEQHLHAWAEVFLPWAGWRGFDPTEGLAVADKHIVLAAAADPTAASPVEGAFRGTGATAEMEYEIHIEAI